LNNGNYKYKKPSERAAGFVLGVFGWIKYIIGSTTTVIPRGYVVQHHGREMVPGKSLQYQSILLVEDDVNVANDFIEVIKDYYAYGSIMILVAHAYDAAQTFFKDEDVNLVVMDADLDDEEGDGATLTREFLSQKPDLAVLANSSSKISNHKLMGYGAIETLGKKPGKLKNWLLLHDPAGSDG
jgi:hypothetical protein